MTATSSLHELLYYRYCQSEFKFSVPPSPPIGIGAGQVGPVLTGPLFHKKLVGVTIITINTCVLVHVRAAAVQYQWLIMLVRGLVIYSCKLAYRRAEDLIKSVRGEDASSELDSVVTFYGDDLDRWPVGIAATVIGSTIQRGSRQAQTTSP